MLQNTAIRLRAESPLAVLLLLAIVLVATATAAQDITVSQNIDRHETAFESSVHMEIVLSWKGEQSLYRFDRALRPDLDRLKVQEFSTSMASSYTPDSVEVTTKTYRYTLVPTSGGTGRIEPITIGYLYQVDSTRGELVTEAMTVEIAQPVPPPEPGELGVMVWIGIGGCLVLLVVLAVAITRSRNQKPVDPFLGPRDTLLKELEILKTHAGSDFKAFQSGFLTLLEAFVKDEFKIDIKEVPDEQLDEQLASTTMTSEQQQQVRDWLTAARRDKYRPMSAAPGETIRRESEIRRFFENM